MERTTSAFCDTDRRETLPSDCMWRSARTPLLTIALIAGATQEARGGVGITQTRPMRPWHLAVDALRGDSDLVGAPSSPSRDGAIVGVVRSSTTGDPLAGASITLAGGEESITSDSTGVYRLRDIQSGLHDISVALTGYDALILSVTVPARGTIRVDLLLSPAPVGVPLEPIHIVAQQPSAPVALPRGRTTIDEQGNWHWSGPAAIVTSATGEPDIFRTLVQDPNVFSRPDRPAVIMDHGVGDDQMLVLLDGLPLWNPVHSGSGLSVVTPDLLDGLTIHDGAIPAEYGDRLGSVLDLHTRSFTQDSAHGGIAFGSVASRLFAGTPFQVGATSGEAMFAVRRSDTDLFPYQSTNQPFWSRWADGAGALTLRHGATTVQFVGIASRDRLDPRASSAISSSTSTSTNNSSDAAESNTTDSAQSSQGSGSPGATASPFPWNTSTFGMIWTQRLAPSAHIDTRLWRATFHAQAEETIGSGIATLGSEGDQWGATSQMVWNQTTVGVSFENLATLYRVALPTNTSNPPLDLHARPTLFAAFAAQEWRSPTGRLVADMGVRATQFAGAHTYLDPRLSVAAHVTDDVTLTAGYTRTHQFIQSLHNQNAPLSALITTEFPVAAGSGGLPVASSDVMTMGVTASLPAHTKLLLDAYTRNVSGIAIPDPASTQLFTTHTFDLAAERATGIGVGLTGQSGRVSWQTVYGIGQTRYTTSSTSATTAPARAVSQMGTASLTFALDRRTQVQLTGVGGLGPQAMQTMWFSQGLLSQTGEHDDDNEALREIDRAAGQTIAADSRLPSYLRFDMQLSHQWPMAHDRTTLSAFLAVANLLNRANEAVYNATSTAAQTVILAPRSVLGGVSLSY